MKKISIFVATIDHNGAAKLIAEIYRLQSENKIQVGTFTTRLGNFFNK